MKSLTDMAGDLDTSTAQVLTAIRIVATRASVPALAQWAAKEMEGYDNDDELPAHRIWNLTIVGNLHNPHARVLLITYEAHVRTCALARDPNQAASMASCNSFGQCWATVTRSRRRKTLG